MISSADGTATAGDDYTSVPPAANTVNFGLNEDSQTVTIAIASDDLVEKDEVLFLTLDNPSPGEAIGSRHKATLTIFDDDGMNVK